jgi:hypothetical protein
VALAPGILKAGTVYFWRFRPLGRESSRGSREDMFVTVAAADEKAFLELEGHLAGSVDPSLQVLLAGVAHSLGLWQEACATLDAAAQNGGSVAGLQQRFDCAGLGHP